MKKKSKSVQARAKRELNPKIEPGANHTEKRTQRILKRKKKKGY